MNPFLVQELFRRAINSTLQKFVGEQVNEEVLFKLELATTEAVHKVYMSLPDEVRKDYQVPMPIIKVEDGLLIIELGENRFFN